MGWVGCVIISTVQAAQKGRGGTRRGTGLPKKVETPSTADEHNNNNDDIVFKEEAGSRREGGQWRGGG